MKKKKIFKINIDTGEYDQFLNQIKILAKNGNGGYVCLANVHMLIEANDNPQFAKVVNNADIVAPDGKPLAIMIKLLHGISQPRVAGMDLLPDLLKISEKDNIPVLFYGSTKSTLEKVKEKLNSEYPDLRLSGLISPPFTDITSRDLDKELSAMKKQKYGIVFIILGCPKQEKFMSFINGRINSVMIGIGGAVPVFTGEISRAPKWMQRTSLEWFYRLMKNPRKMWKRYFYTNTKFLVLAASNLAYFLFGRMRRK